MPTLPELLSRSKSDIEEISKYFNELLTETIQRVTRILVLNAYPNALARWNPCQRINVNYPVIELGLGRCLSTLSAPK